MQSIFYIIPYIVTCVCSRLTTNGPTYKDDAMLCKTFNIFTLYTCK